MFAYNKRFDMADDPGWECNGRKVEQIINVMMCTTHDTSTACI
jgi:hypothetical protein